jgi:GH25 family lysozyme M1 (1,4-beta-N-acetylmuramidase)
MMGNRALSRGISTHLKSLARKMAAATVAFAMLLFSAEGVFAVSSYPVSPSQHSGDHVFYGIDVSEWQDGIDWYAVKRSGVDYAFIRAGATKEGSFTLGEDSLFQSNMTAAEKAGVARGIYWYSQAVSEDEAVSEAKAVVRLADRTSPELPVVMDVELSDGRLRSAYDTWKAQGGSVYAGKRLTEIASAFTSYCRKHGYSTCVYASSSMLGVTGGIDTASLSASGTEIWEALYQESNTSSFDYSYWQYTSRGSSAGISGNVDLDCMYVSDSEIKGGHPDVHSSMKYEEVRYTGKPLRPEVRVSDGSSTLREGSDYTVSYMENTARGRGYAVVRGKGRYVGYMNCLSFRIGSENIRHAPESEPSDVVTKKTDKGTKVMFTAAEESVSDYRISYRYSGGKWHYVYTGGDTEYTIEGTPSEIRVSSVRGGKVIGSARPDNSKKKKLIRDAVRTDTSVSSLSSAGRKNVSKIDEEVRRDVSF